MSEKNVCRRCRYFQPLDADEGLCRVSPPRPVPYLRHDDRFNDVLESDHDWLWPKVEPTDWCGQYYPQIDTEDT